jgi:hypothetical protein
MYARKSSTIDIPWVSTDPDAPEMDRGCCDDCHVKMGGVVNV